jgi:prepilin-type N-terminal cleavage/methylation domain-containing protein
MKRQRFPLQHIIHNARGFTLFEILLAIVILVIAILPMVNAFAPAHLSTGQAEEQAILTGQARSALNGLLNLDFKTLNDPNNKNKDNPDAVVALLGDQWVSGMIIRVIDSDIDAEHIGGLLELKVRLKNVKLQTLKAER